MSKALLFNKGIPTNTYMKAPIELPNPVQLMKGDDFFPSNEHYFHCCKVALSSDGSVDMYREIRDAPTWREAKRLGRQVPLDPGEVFEWDTHRSLVAMLECNLAKFRQHEHCADWLRGTGRRRLVEHRPDKIWGDGMDGTGQNRLGRILQLIRATL